MQCQWTSLSSCHRAIQGGSMKPRFDAIGLVVSNLTASIAFYRHLGIDFPDPTENGHIEATLPGGMRFMMDTVEEVRSFDLNWTPPSGGHRIALAFLCQSPAEVDQLYRRLIDEGAAAH